MEGFLNFLANNYIWFLMVAILLIFALIGYLIDNKGNNEERLEPMPKQLEEVGVQTMENKPLNEVITNNATPIQTEMATPLETQGLGEANEETSTVSEVLSEEEK